MRAWTLIATVAAMAAAATPSSAVDEPTCRAEQVEYTLGGKLELRDTPMGQGDGVYTVGPGKAVLRFDGRNVTMLSYSMQERFTVKSKTLFWTTTVVTNAVSSATPDACSIVAEGSLDGNVVRWRTPVSGYHTIGTLDCTGSLCGTFGAPPSGRSALRIGPNDIPFGPFVFSSDMKTFTMAKTPGVRTEQPKQSSSFAIAGREVSRKCAAVPPCAR